MENPHPPTATKHSEQVSLNPVSPDCCARFCLVESQIHLDRIERPLVPVFDLVRV